MESDNEDMLPELSKMESKVIQEIIGELSEDPFYVTTGDQLFSLFTKLQVQPEKQLKMVFNLAYELSELSENCTGEMSDQYLRLSTLATVAVQEKFGQCQEASSRKGRTAKANAKINMQSYFDEVEPTLLNDSDEDTSKKRRKREEKVEWSDSELQETDPLPAEPVIAAEAVEESGGKEDAQSGISAPIVEKEREEDQDMDTVSVTSSKSSLVRVSQRKRVFDVVCIDSSSEEESMPAPGQARKITTPEPTPTAPATSIPSSTVQSSVTPKPQTSSKNQTPKPSEISPNSPTKTVASKPSTSSTKGARLSGGTKKRQSKPRSKPPQMSEDSVKDLISACDKADEAPESPLPTSPEPTKKADTKEQDKDASKPVGVVKATPRGVQVDSKRSTNNAIKEDESLILNFKKGHYPSFQTSYTHLVVAKKENNDLYTDSAPTVKEILAMDGEVIPGSEMKKYVLKQFIHNESGQFLIGEIDENLFFMVPGLINKSKEGT